jgi:heme exporter protein A
VVILISVEQLCKKIGYMNLLENINLSLPSRQVTVIFGPNGVGKSTLLKIISTLLPLTNGQILYRGQSVYKQLSKFRQAIGLVMHD